VSPTEAPWWQTAVLYQVYPRSFADSNGDGIGDLPGLIAHLDHLAWLGVSGIWLSPVTVSPNADWGYDVSDYCAIAPELGTMADFDRLVVEATARGIRLIMDFVPNHTSAEHPWFVDARSSRTSDHRDWYVWGDPKTDGTPPNNWVSSFGGAGWTLDEGSGQYYFHNHLVEQPDLNWWNDEVRDTFDDIFTFWADRGAAGFRIDVCNILVKDKELRDNPPATEDDDFETQMFGQRPVYNANRPELHEVLQRWRQLSEARPDPFLLLGETPVPIDDLVRYYGNGSDELHLAFNFNFISADFERDAMRGIVEETEAALPAAAWPAWTGSNHDMFRFPTRWAHDDPALVRLALLMLLSLRGTAVLYQGDEIGQGNAQLAREDLRDPLGVQFYPYYEGRDAGRTPMQWEDSPGGGFTTADATPWLPLGDLGAANVAAELDDPGSILFLARDLIAFRHTHREFTLGHYRTVPSSDQVWAFNRGEGYAVALNFSAEPAPISGLAGVIERCTDRDREGEKLTDSDRLGSHQGLILRIDRS
jgi:alpha-glucosidase